MPRRTAGLPATRSRLRVAYRNSKTYAYLGRKEDVAASGVSSRAGTAMAGAVVPAQIAPSAGVKKSRHRRGSLPEGPLGVDKRPSVAGSDHPASSATTEETDHVRRHQNRETRSSRTPWNKGKLTGPKPPLKVREIWAIRIRLQLASGCATSPCSTSPSTASCAAATWSRCASATSPTAAPSRIAPSSSSTRPSSPCSSS